MKQNFFFQIATWIFKKKKCSLEFDVYFIELCNFVADDKEQLDVFIHQCQLYFCLLKLLNIRTT